MPTRKRILAVELELIEARLRAALAACLERLVGPCDCDSERDALRTFYDEALAPTPAGGPQLRRGARR